MNAKKSHLTVGHQEQWMQPSNEPLDWSSDILQHSQQDLKNRVSKRKIKLF